MHLKVALSLVFLAVSAVAQSAGGLAGMSGVVRDPSGSVVPNAKVVVSNDSNGTARILTTNEAGLFTAPALTPAAGYKVAVTAEGFMAHEARNIELQVGQNLGLEVNLKVAAAASSVDVVSSAPLIEETKTNVSGVVDSKAITD